MPTNFSSPSGGASLQSVGTATDWADLLTLSPADGDAVYLEDADQLVVYPSAAIGWIPAPLANADRTGLSTEVSFWADANDIVAADHTAGALATWPLKTGSTKATTPNSPTYSATGGPGGTTPAVTLNGSNQRIAWPSDHLGVLNDAEGFLLMMLVRASGLGGSNIGTFFSINNSAGASTFKANYQTNQSVIRIGTAAPTFAGQNLTIPISTGSWHVVGFQALRNGDKCRIYSSDDSDGWRIVDTTGGLNGNTGNFPAVDAVEAFLGCQNPLTTPNDHWAGTISESIGLTGSWSRLERRAETIGALWQSKWGL